MYNIQSNKILFIGDKPIDFYKFTKKGNYIDVLNIKDESHHIKNYSLSGAYINYHELTYCDVISYVDDNSEQDLGDMPDNEYEIIFKKIIDSFIEKYGSQEFYVYINTEGDYHNKYTTLHLCCLNDIKYLLSLLLIFLKWDRYDLRRWHTFVI